MAEGDILHHFLFYRMDK